ncbi:helicase associated domain-containing protein [Streptomyces sp. NPDC089799]|uniref:helicase associated domain-containing protein n=1 Tax=Streptomyces sp. NPDC089799 TaxID=3155066 RepID=UPI003440392A
MRHPTRATRRPGQYAGLKALLAGGARLAGIVAGVTRHGEDIGRWTATQRRDFHRLSEEQQRRLAELGVKPARAVRARSAPAKTSTAAGPGRGAEAFQTGIQALTQYIEREGSGLPGRQHVEHLAGAVHRTGVWLANQKQRRNRLDTAQLEALAALGVQWAQ